MRKVGFSPAVCRERSHPLRNAIRWAGSQPTACRKRGRLTDTAERVTKAATNAVATALFAMKNTLIRCGLLALLELGLTAGLHARAQTQSAPMPKVGDKAPLFTGKDQDEKTWKLERYIGRKILVLYFYPKDDTPGCTREACGFRDRMEELKKQGVEVVGVSFDSPESHRQFRAKHNLNFTLLADTDGKIAEAYGVRVPGRKFARRVSFLIGLDGRIAHVTDSPQAETHLNEMTEAIGRLKAVKPAALTAPTPRGVCGRPGRNGSAPEPASAASPAETACGRATRRAAET